MGILEKITEKHKNDKEHLEFIFSDEKRIVVTAPAGCGKTTAMISKIAWELTKDIKPDHKKILAMSFSINAATKIKDSLNEMLPDLIDNPNFFSNKVDISNYHNFAMRLLYKYGFDLDSELINLSEYTIIDDRSPILNKLLTSYQLSIINNLNDKINNLDFDNIEQNIYEYYKIFSEVLFKENIISYNAILIAGYKLLSIESIRKFFRKYYKMIIIDEFQDTNYLAYLLISQLIGEENKLIIMGDDVQKIYGFLGALPNILTELEKKHGMKKIEFLTNYRFKNNQNMRELDRLLREYNINHTNNGLTANINVKRLINEKEENDFIVDGIETIINTTDNKVAVLVRANYMASSLLDVLNSKNIRYFNALFGDSDIEYIKFHKIALEIIYKYTNGKEIINKSITEKCIKEIITKKEECCSTSNKEYIFDSLYQLIKILFNQLNLLGQTTKEKYEKVMFILSSNGLKRMMEFVSDRVIITTIHSAKGLEWDYIIIPRMMAYSFPTSNALCKNCHNFGNNIEGYDFCKYGFTKSLNKYFEDEMSVFYVAITRARREVFITLNNEKNLYGYPKKTACFIQLDGMNEKIYEWREYFNENK